MSTRVPRLAVPASALVLLALVGGALVTAPAVSAAPTASAYTAHGASDLVHVNAANIPGVVDVADATVAPVTSTVSSAASPRVVSHATNASVGLLGALTPNLVVDAVQAALPDHATGVHAELLTVPAAPALTATVTSADAHSRWNADGSCITLGPLSTSIDRVADLAVLPSAVGGAAVATLSNSHDPSGAVVSQSGARLVKPASATNYGVQTTSLTEITSLSILGTLTVDVLTAPKAVALATGVGATSKVDLTQPVIRVNGTTYLAGQVLTPISIPGAPVIELKVGQLSKTVAADGTSASGSGYLLSLKVLDVTGTITLADLTIGDISAAATSPAGGVSCTTLTPDPLRDARKDASAATVNPKRSFDYTVTVPNRGNAPLTDVTLVDTLGGTPSLTLVGAVPAPTARSGSSYTFTLGTIAPNQTKSVTLSFTVPASATAGTKYTNTAVITATYGGQPVTKTVTASYPTVDAPGTTTCDLSRSTKFASHLKVTTGETFSYYVNVFNQGRTGCRGVTVKDVLPAGVSFASCTHECTHAGRSVTWSLGSLAAGASTQLAVVVRATATTGTLPNTADITAATGTGGRPSTAGPTVASVSVLAPTDPAVRGGASSRSLPSTGGSLALALGGLSALAAAFALRRRSRTN